MSVDLDPADVGMRRGEAIRAVAVAWKQVTVTRAQFNRAWATWLEAA